VRRSPGFAAVVALTLGLGVGANATMFGIIDRLLLRPPAMLHAPGETGRVYLTFVTEEGEEHIRSNMSYKRYLELREGTTSFAQTAAFFNRPMVVGDGTRAERLGVGQVSASFFPFFGVRPALGRFFTPEEDSAPVGSPVVVLAHGFWRSRFGGDSAILGARLAIGSEAYTIIGVAPRGFSGVDPRALAAFIPITSAAGQTSTDYHLNHSTMWMEMIARRKPGVSPEAAAADLTAAFRRSLAAEAEARPREVAESRVQLESILLERGPRQGDSAKVATWLGGMSVIVLLIACANVANLLVARALRRRREIAVRIALGAGRARLLRQLLTESVMLAGIGGAAGLLLAHWGGGVLRSVLLPDVEWGSTLADLRTLLFTGAAAVTTGILAGVAPVAQTGRRDVAGDLKAGSREGTRRQSGLRTALLVAQAALSVILLVGAGLFVRSLHNVRSLDMGYDAGRVLYVTIDERRAGNRSWSQEARLFEPYQARATGLPYVEAVSTTLTIPFWIGIVEDIYVPGIDSVGRLGQFFLHAVGPDYFATMGTRLRRGRAFTEADRAGAPLAIIVSESMARRLWPGTDPLGQCVRVGADTMPCRMVVGVSQDIHGQDLRAEARYQYYVPSAQRRGWQVSGLVVRVRGDARRAAEPLRRDLQAIATGNSYVDVRPLQDIVDPEVRPWRLGATMFGVFGLLALVMAAVGLYSVIAYDVAHRTHELGVRVALGARAAHVLRLVVGQGVRVSVVGVALGAALALVAASRIGGLLYQVRPADPITFITVAAMLLLVAVAASLVPALRATRVDPTVALRAD
jgi:predicted permease